MGRIVPQMDLLIGNECDADDLLGIHAGNTEGESGSLELDRYPDVAR